MLKNLTFIVFTSIFSNIFAQTESEWNSIDDSKYFINYPSDWELNNSGLMGTSFILFSPVSSSQDNFRENINLLVQDLSQYDLNLDKYVEISVNQVKSMITNAKIIENKTIKSKNGDFQEMIYTGDQGMYHLKFVQYYWIKNDSAFVLTLTTESNKFMDYKVIGERILNSFVIK